MNSDALYAALQSETEARPRQKTSRLVPRSIAFIFGVAMALFMVQPYAPSVAGIPIQIGFVWLIAHAGPVFAAQVGYIVTTGGVVLGMVFLDDFGGA